MRQESNHKSRSNREFKDIKISNSRAMGVIILIALLFLFQVVTFVVQKLGTPNNVATAEESAGGTPVQRFFFNPNTIPPDSLVLLGFSPKQAQTVVNYREKGGKFRKVEDFAKLYVVDSAMYNSLKGYIVIPTPSQQPKREVAKIQKREKFTPHPAQKKAQKMVQKDTAQREKDTTLRGKTTPDVYGKKVEKNRYICNLNTADSASLVQLYGIGPYFAKKILQYREALGGSFADIRQLLEIEGFSQERFDKLSESILVNKKDIIRFSLLDVSKEFLERHPYIGPYAARGIIVYIQMKGEQITKDNLKLLQELVKEGIISENNSLRLKEYLIHL